MHAFQKHSYIQKFPTTSFLLSGVSHYKNTIKNIKIDDVLMMTLEPNVYDATAIIIKCDGNVCGYVPKDIKGKVVSYVPSKVKVIDKRHVENDIYSLRVDIVSPLSYTLDSYRVDK